MSTLDAEKALDQVNWIFLFTTINIFECGKSFINWIKTLYNSPKATATINGLASSSITQHRCLSQILQLSNDSINWSKSTLLQLSKKSWNPAASSPMTPSSTDTVRYLGIYVSTKLSELVPLNFNLLIKTRNWKMTQNDG